MEFINNFAVVRGSLNGKLQSNVRRATMFLDGEVKRTIGSGQRTGKVYKVPGTQRKYTASAPGQAPAVMLGNYINSITHKVEMGADTITGTVGTNMKQGKRLEFGFVGTDSKGRRYNQAPRPHFKVTYEKNKQKIQNKLAERIEF